jgi:hypothetical protein
VQNSVPTNNSFCVRVKFHKFPGFNVLFYFGTRLQNCLINTTEPMVLILFDYEGLYKNVGRSGSLLAVLLQVMGSLGTFVRREKCVQGS